MNKIFEDEFMELQSGLISLCMEVTEGRVDKIFVYCSNEKHSKMFNAFFAVNDELKKLHELGIPRELIEQFLSAGTNDVCALDAIGERHNRQIPTELKLYYDVKSGHFEARYKYEPVCSAAMGISPVEIYWNWISEIKREYHFN